MCANGKNIRNSDRFKSYKGQLLIYNLIVGLIQKYIPPTAYIMAKSWTIESNKNYEQGYSCYDLLGVIDYKTFDKKYIKMTSDAIDWINNLKNNGHNWDPYNPHIKEMCCNASNSIDSPWTEIKYDVLKKTKDITCIWNINYEHRNKIFDLNINNYTSKELTPEILGLKDNSKTKVIKEILKINQQNNKNIHPEKIKNKKER